jgi:hypothetical protein
MPSADNSNRFVSGLYENPHEKASVSVGRCGISCPARAPTATTPLRAWVEYRHQPPLPSTSVKLPLIRFSTWSVTSCADAPVAKSPVGTASFRPPAFELLI